MNKSMMKIGCLLLSAMTAFSFFACGGGGSGGGGGDSSSSSSVSDSSNSSGSSGSSSSTPGTNSSVPIAKPEKYDPEKRAMVFSTDALDGNFNPFFATSATDSTIAAVTQASMLTTDKLGNPLCGEEEPTVALAYKQTMYDSDGNETADASKAAKTAGGSTAYEFILKNGMKFSDGTDLTIKDVLFNLYVYLDPSYMGSATIYSTDIKGLTAYREQDINADDSANESADESFYAEADTRIYNLLEYLNDEADLSAEIEADIATVKKLFREEVESDWTTVSGTQESYEDEYTFTEDWEIYYFNEGIIQIQYEQGKPLRDEDGKYITSLDKTPEYAEEIEAVKNGENPKYVLQDYVDSMGCSLEEAAEYAVKDFAIDTVYDAYTLTNGALAGVVSYWATGSKARDEFAAEARTEYFESMKGEDGSLAVKSIRGITTHTTTEDFNGNDLGEEHDVLRIEINGVDPKAIWNFAFSVSPMHYYSGGEVLTAAQNDDGTSTNQWGEANQYLNFGVDFANKTFFDEVLQDPEKTGVPMGAGAYKASKAPNTSKVDRTTFYRNNWVYFERNEYFDTMGGETIYNANIKYLQYRVVGSDKIMQALQAGNIDFGSPQATTYNISQAEEYNDTLGYSQYRTNGYGYVGINPKYVPDIEVRQAIMMAMDTAMIIRTYYTDKLADVIYRSMSKESWAYPDDCEPYYEYTTDSDEIKDLVESAGWKEGKDGIYEKDGDKLKITFTIAGETTDHPAYEMFQDAADFLNECGFDVSVTTDVAALKKLATGGLAVWAAAWNSTIDPDLYQVYHKDSKATSIKNWGYETIFADDGEQFGYEQIIIDDLSLLIEQARETLDEETRASIYSEALDLIMELAVELPTYQRNDLVVYNKSVINVATLNTEDPSANEGVYDRIWEVNYL